MKFSKLLTTLRLSPALFGLAILCNLGCENKQKVLDIETPSGQVEVTRDRDTGAVGIDATDQETVVDVNAPGASVEVKRDAESGSVDVDTTGK